MTPSSSAPSDVRVRAITPDELQAFARFSSGPAYTFAPAQPAAFEAWLRHYRETGSSRPDWCFVAERDGRWLGSVVYEGDVQGQSLHVEHMRLPWRTDYLELGRILLRESLRLLDADRPLEYVYGFLTTPPLTERARAARKRLLEHAGFAFRRLQLYYVWSPGDEALPSLRHPGRITFRSLAEVGEAAWVDADTRVRQKSLIPEMAAGGRSPREPLFPPGHIPTDEPQFWQLAYDSAGSLIGLVVPRRNGPASSAGSIRWIGVVPERRGRGYVDDLLARGLEILVAAGVDLIHAATDIRNTPMQAAFPRMGFQQTETRWWYELDPAQLRESPARNAAVKRAPR